jgi:hypothetical protein
MGIQKEYHQLLSQFTTDYNLEPITSRLSAIIKESLNNSSLKKHRQGTILIPIPVNEIKIPQIIININPAKY